MQSSARKRLVSKNNRAPEGATAEPGDDGGSSAKQQLDHGPGHLIAKILGAHTIAVILCAAR